MNLKRLVTKHNQSKLPDLTAAAQSFTDPFPIKPPVERPATEDRFDYGRPEATGFNDPNLEAYRLSEQAFARRVGAPLVAHEAKVQVSPAETSVDRGLSVHAQ